MLNNLFLFYQFIINFLITDYQVFLWVIISIVVVDWGYRLAKGDF